MDERLEISGMLVRVTGIRTISHGNLADDSAPTSFFRFTLVTGRDSAALGLRLSISMFVASGMFLFLLTLSQYLELFAKHAHLEARQMAEQPRVRDEPPASQKRSQ
jgi:hypothetical protein